MSKKQKKLIMKLFLFSIFFLLSICLYASEWEELGGSASGGGISNTGANSIWPAVAVSHYNEVVVVWKDESSGGHIYLKKFQGGSWIELGGSASGTGIDGLSNPNLPSVAIDSQGRILVAYCSDCLYFKRWNGTAWEELGGSGSSGIVASGGGDSIGETFVTTDINGQPVVGMTEGNYPQFALAAYYWNGASWESFGGAIPSNGTNYTPSIARAPNGDLWLVCDHGNENGSNASIYVYHYTGGTWTLEGDLFALANNKRPSVAVDSLGRPVVTWMSGTLASSNYRVMVARWDGASWSGFADSDTGNGISDPSDDAGLPSVAIGEGDMPVVAYIQESSASNWLCVKAFNGTSWSEFGASSATEPGLASGCGAVVYYRDHPTQDNGWFPHFRKVSIARNSRALFFVAWEREAEDNVFGEKYGELVAGTGAFTYNYDALYRLTDIKTANGITISYDYDSAGNRMHKKVTSKLMVKAGEHNPGLRNLSNTGIDLPIMQVAFDVTNEEALVLRYVTFNSFGTGNEVSDVSFASLWNDINNNGEVDPGDTKIGSNSSFTQDDGLLNFSGLSQTIAAGGRLNLLVTFTLSGSAILGNTFHLSLLNSRDIVVTGASSGEYIYALGCPVDGGTLTVSDDTAPPSFGGIESATAYEGDILLEWTPATDISEPITYNIYEATSSGSQNFSSPSYSITDTTMPISNYLVTGLGLGPTYYYVVRAEDSVGNEANNLEEAYATPSDSTPPDFDGIQSATALLDGSEDVRLTWNAATDPSIPITYNIYWATSSGGQNFATPNESTTGYSIDIDGLTEGQEHFFVVRAEDAHNNESTNIEELSATPTALVDSEPPLFGGLESATAPNDGSNRINLSWSVATDDSLPISYCIYQSLISGGQNFSSPAYTTQSLTYEITGLNSGQTYYYVVRARDALGAEDENEVEKSATPLDTIDNDPPVFAGLRRATGSTDESKKIYLSWDSAQDQSLPITYHIYRDTIAGGNIGTLIKSVQGMTLEDRMDEVAEFNQIYYYVVRAEDSGGNVETNIIEKNAQATDELPPIFAGLENVVRGDGYADLSWSAASDISSPITYNAYKSLVSMTVNPAGYNFGTPEATTQDLTCRINGLDNETVYYFIVRAQDTYNNEDDNEKEIESRPTTATHWFLFE